MRDLPHWPEKVRRALIEPHLLAEWLASTDFVPALGHHFTDRIDPQPDKSFVFAL